MSRTAVCTIASKNYLHFCRTLMDSVRRVQEIGNPQEVVGEYRKRVAQS